MKWLYSTSFLLVSVDFGTLARELQRHNITIKCDSKQDPRSLVSPNYPEVYDTLTAIVWIVQVDSNRRINIEFNDFWTYNNDILTIVDLVNTYNTESYSGETGTFTPFLSRGNNVSLNFISGYLDIRRRGFNLSISCLQQHDDELLHEGVTDKYYVRKLKEVALPLCREGWTMEEADTVCLEAGYPGAQDDGLNTDGGELDQGMGKRFTCQPSSYRLGDCIQSNSNCSRVHAVNITCNDHGYLGCYNFRDHREDLLNPHTVNTREDCITHCNESSTEYQQFAALYEEGNCSCINQSRINVNDLSHRSHCRDDHNHRFKRTINGQPDFWVDLFDSSVGFCESPPTLRGGRWTNPKNAKSFYKYSTVNAQCDDGYRLEAGNVSLTCGPDANSPNYNWTGTVPFCKLVAYPTPAQMPTSDSAGKKTVAKNLILISFFVAVTVQQHFKF